MPPAKTHSNLERKEIYKVEYILSLLQQKYLNKVFSNNMILLKRTYKDDKDLIIGGDPINIFSLRYFTFLNKGVDCVACGLKGIFFAKERIKGSTDKFHLNLYALNSRGEEVLMTKDHIVPKAVGGPDKLSNLNPMCKVCNENKSNQKKKKEVML